ncbi:MAG: outer membrane protein assembly factor BamA, partial [Candidatus Omnitrophica bacterium]|nr:outer membrane protein assembly factor BamA [Candidatus Omnitrophota bacterium]
YKIKNLNFFLIMLFLTLSFVSPSTAIAQEGSPRKLIKYVDVRNNKTVSSAKVLSKLKTKRGEEFLEKVVNEDVKRLYLMGFFSDVSVSIEEAGSDEVGVVFVVTEKPPLTMIKFTGNRIYREKKFSTLVKSKLNEFCDERSLKRDAEAIEDLYKRAGYPWVKVSYRIDVNEETNAATVVFVIDEGARAVVRRITILGNTAFSDKRLTKVIKSRPSGFFRSGVYKQDVIEDDIERLKHFYKQEGFLDADASYETITKGNKRKKWLELAIRIDEGRKYITGDVKMVSNAVFSEEELKSVLKMRPGDTFTESALHQDVASVQEHYFDKGYIMAKVKPDNVLNLETDRVDITYTISEGEICYVNKIDIKGNTKTKDVVVRREMRIYPGEKYDGGKLKRSKERLYNLGFFEDITFDVEDTAVPNKKDMVVEVKESKTGEFSFGGGFSSIDKLIGFVEIEQRNFDLFNFPTFTGDGQDLKLRGEFGSVRKNYLLSWTEPWIFDHPLSFGFDLYASERNRSGSTGYAYDEVRQGGVLRFGKEFSDYLRGDLVYRLENVDISDLSIDASQALKDEEGKKTISSVFLQLTRDTRDNRFNPLKGILVSGSVEVAGGFMGGDRDFAKFFNSNSHYSTIGPFVLELKLREGIVSSYGDSDRVPIYERFFAGGTYTVRGYKERDVGPKDISGDAVGGGAMAVANAELTFSIVQNLKGAFFVDAGSVWSTPDSDPEGGTTTRGIKVGLGTGVRIKTPIGPVKLDLGFPVNADEWQEDKPRFHFSMSRGF